MLNRFERQKQELLIFAVACTLCGIFLVSMLVISWADLLVISASSYQEQTIELSKANDKIKRLEYELENPEEVINWEDIEG